MKFNKKQIILAIILLVFSFFVFIINKELFFNNIYNDVSVVDKNIKNDSNNSLESVTKVNTKSDYSKAKFIDCDCEKRFKKEYPIVWSGEVTASFVSGADFAVKRFKKDSKYKQFYVQGQNKYLGDLGGKVTVIGRLIGTTCAYANTVFGECTGEVIADEVIILNN